MRDGAQESLLAEAMARPLPQDAGQQPVSTPSADEALNQVVRELLQTIPQALAAQYWDLWENTNPNTRVACLRLISDTAAALRAQRVPESTATPTPTTSLAPGTGSPRPGADDRADSEKRRAILKTIVKIRDYNGKIPDEAAREYLYDCERYFRQIAEFSHATMTDWERIMHASSSLTGQAAKTWRYRERQVDGGFEKRLESWDEYKKWIMRNFSEHLSAAKRWDRFRNTRQGDKQSFMEYVTQLRQAAMECEQTIPDAIFFEFMREGAKKKLQERWAEERNPPTKLDEIIERFRSYEEAATIAGYYRRQAPAADDGGEPMDLGAMPSFPNRRGNGNRGRGGRQGQGRRNPFTCFACGQPGHRMADCELRKKILENEKKRNGSNQDSKQGN